MAANHSLNWSYRNPSAFAARTEDVMPDEARQLGELAESMTLDDLRLDITLEDIEADLRYGRD